MNISFDHIDINRQESSLDDVHDIIIELLEKRFKGYPQKSTVDKSDNRFTFACPYCGDSHTDMNKKRGNFYFESKDFICFNCGVRRDYKSFFKDMRDDLYLDSNFTIPKLTVIEGGNYSSTVTSSLSNVYQFDLLSDKYGISIKDLKWMYGLKDISDSAKLSKYLERRCITPTNDKFLYSPYNDSIFILNINNDSKKVLSFQIRQNPYDKTPKSSKYITMKLKNIYAKGKLNFDESDEDLAFLNKVSKFFNFTNISLKKRIYITEGSLDSLLLKNSFALCGLNDTSPIDNKNVHYIMDFDSPGRKKQRELIQDGKNCLLWKKFLTHSGVDYEMYNKIDLTDLCKSGVSLSNIGDFFSSKPFDRIWI